MTHFVLPWKTEIFVPALARKVVTILDPTIMNSIITLPEKVFEDLEVVRTVKLTTALEKYSQVDQVRIAVTLPQVGIRNIVCSVFSSLNGCELILGRSALQGFVVDPN